MRALTAWLQSIWYGSEPPPWYLTILSKWYAMYLRRLPKPFPLTREPMPVIVVGNVVAGGSGKTPLVIYLAELAMREGYRVVVTARIYKGSAKGPLPITEETTVAQVGDEPLLLNKRLNCPIVVSRKRSQSIDYINNNIECDLIFSDDGLQHHALHRAVQVGVIDGRRGLGNGYLLPAGPLREPKQRLEDCHWIISKGACQQYQTIVMQIQTEHAIHLKTGEIRTLESFAEQSIIAIAGIADPESFFAILRDYQLTVQEHGFPDHYQYQQAELSRLRQTPDSGQALLMTEKDAMKCMSMDINNVWYVPMSVQLPESFQTAFIQRCAVLVEKS